MGLTIRPKIKAKGRERESGIERNTEQSNITDREGERKWGREKRIAYGGEG